MRGLALVVLGAGLVAAMPGFGTVMRDGALGAFARLTGGTVFVCVVLAWGVEHALLAPLGLASLRTFAVVMIVASAVMLGMLAAQRRPAAAATRVHVRMLALAIASCSALATAATDVASLSFPALLLHASVAGIGAGVALPLFAALRERSDAADVPAPLRGMPIALVNAALVALALVGVAGLDVG